MEAKTELQRNAVATARRKELEIFQRALDVQWLNSRMDDGRMGRCLALIQREAAMEKDFQERTDHAAIVNARAAKETSLGIEVAKVCREEACQLLRRHYLRERDPSLRELIKKLQSGYVCRDLQLQIKNNEYKKLQEIAEENKANTVLLNALHNNKEAEELEAQMKIEDNIRYRKELQQQLVSHEQQKRCLYEESLIEKKMLEDIARTLADEDQRELAHKREITARIKKEMVASQQTRAAWKMKQKEMVVKEEKEIERQLAAAADRSSAIIAERERKRLEKEALNEKICAKILADSAEIREREEIIKLLQEQEYLEKNVNDDVSEKVKADATKRNTKEALTAQMENRRAKAALARETEAKFRKEVEEKTAAEKQKELEKEMEKRRRGRQYSKELLQQIQANEEKRRKNKEMEDGRAQYVLDYDKAWRKEVSAERSAIVRSHAPSLIGYLGAGALAPADLPALCAGAATNPALTSLNIEALAASERPRRFAKCNAQCKVLREY